MALASPCDHIYIALCTYQAERFIVPQIDSILAQSHQNFSINIFDDCSDDATLSIISHYQQANTNIYLHINSSCVGFVKNFEQAITTLSSKGAYIALCDQDDLWHEDKLALGLHALKSSEKMYPKKPVLVHSDLRLIDEEGCCIHGSFFTQKRIALPAEKSLAKILGYNGVMGNTLMMNNQLAKLALPFPDALKYHDYWLALVNEVFGVRMTLNQRLVDYRIHQHNASENRALKQTDVKKRPQRPFTADNRAETLAYFLRHYELEDSDREVVEAFCNYLNQNKNRFSTVLLLLRYSFLRRDWRYRLRVFRRLIFGLYHQPE